MLLYALVLERFNQTLVRVKMKCSYLLYATAKSTVIVAIYRVLDTTHFPGQYSCNSTQWDKDCTNHCLSEANLFYKSFQR